jgi:ferritin-like metal-binding protein YciE
MQSKNLLYQTDLLTSSIFETEENMLSNSEKGQWQLMQNVLTEMNSSEQTLLKQLPRIIRHVKTCDLIEALADLMEETKKQLQTIRQLFTILKSEPEQKECASVSEFIKEAGQTLKQYERGYELDTALLEAIQKLKRFEIASYFMLSTLALKLNESELASTFRKLAAIETEISDKLFEVSSDMENHISSTTVAVELAKS